MSKLNLYEETRANKINKKNLTNIKYFLYHELEPEVLLYQFIYALACEVIHFQKYYYVNYERSFTTSANARVFFVYNIYYIIIERVLTEPINEKSNLL